MVKLEESMNQTMMESVHYFKSTTEDKISDYEVKLRFLPYS